MNVDRGGGTVLTVSVRAVSFRSPVPSPHIAAGLEGQTHWNAMCRDIFV